MFTRDSSRFQTRMLPSPASLRMTHPTPRSVPLWPIQTTRQSQPVRYALGCLASYGPLLFLYVFDIIGCTRLLTCFLTGFEPVLLLPIPLCHDPWYRCPAAHLSPRSSMG